MGNKLTLAFAVFLPLLFLLACERSVRSSLSVGISSGYLFATVYVAKEELGGKINTQRFRSLSDVGISLLAGSLDVGFVEAERISALSSFSGFERLTAIGKITYPFGATIVLRRGLGLRINELDGLSIAVSSPNCALREAFLEDAERLGIDVSLLNWQYMAFDAMMPALEARVVDAAIITGVNSATALQAGHSILYQNWELEAGDGCCPAVIDQMVLVLLAQRDRVEAAQGFVQALLNAQNLSPDDLRRAVSKSTSIPLNILQDFPVPQFSLAGDELVEKLIASAKKGCSVGNHNHGQDLDCSYVHNNRKHNHRRHNHTKSKDIENGHK